MTDERRLTFVADGSTSDLQAACARAAEAIRALGEEATKQARAQLAAGQRTVKSNEAVAASYGTAADAARAAAQSATSSAARQTAAAEKTSAASKAAANAAKTAAAEQEAAAAATQTASEKTATVAQATATKQRKASAEAASAAKTSATEQEAAAARTTAAFGKSGSALTHFGRNSAIAIVGAAALTADWGVKFESSLTKLHTQAGVTTKNMQALGRGIIAMAPAVGEVPLKLSEGMYHVASSMDAVLPRAQRVRDELAILRAAAQGAQIGGSDLEQTTYALSSAMNALGLRGRDATRTMAEINAAVGAGDMRMADMTSAMSTGYIPAAENFGVSLQSINAALAYMTDRGTPAQLSATRLRMSLSLLGAPTKQAAKMLDALGMSSGDVRARTDAMTTALQKAGLNTTTLAADLRRPDGLAVALNDLKTHLHESGLNAEASAALISRAFGGGRSGAAIMEMVQHTDILAKKYVQIGAGVRHFGADWAATQHTIQFQANQLKASVVDLGTKLGLALIPRLQEAINSLRDIYHWFHENQAAARALAVVFGGVLTVAMTAWFVSLVRKLIAASREVAVLVRGVGSIPSMLDRAIAGTSVAATTEPGGGGASTLLGHTAMIGGLRSGFGMPGSAVNPLVVMMAGGGLGGAGVLAGEEATVARGAESVTRGGVILPPGVSAGVEGELAATAPAVEASVLGTVRAAAGSIVGGLAKGAGIAGVGYLGSQLAGSVIGGHTGHVVSGVGSGAAIGAGLGSLIGPEGTVGGAIVGGLIGLFRSISHSASEKLAAEAVKGLRPDIKANYQPRIQNDAKALAAARQNLRNLNEQRNAYTQPGAAGNAWLDPSKMPSLGALEAARKRVIALEQRTGADMEHALQAGWNRYAVPDAGHMLDQFEAKFKNATPGVRDAAAQSMIEFAHGLEQSGRLPKGATDAIIHDLEARYPELASYLRQVGETSNRNLARALGDRRVETAVHDQIAQVMGSFQSFGDTLRALGGNTQGQWRTTMAFLVSQTQHGTQQTRAIASQELSAMVEIARRGGGDFANWMALGTARGAGAAATNLSSLTQVFGVAMGDIVGQTQSLSRAFGVRAVNYVAQHPKQVVATGLQAAVGLVGALTHAAGGGFIGSPGERGRDTVHAVLGRGEAVANAHQQPYLEVGLAVSHALGAQPYDSLSSLFRGERRKHYLASGGFAGGQVFTASVFGGHNDPSAFNKPTASGKIANDSLWGFAELSNPPGSLNFAALGHLPLGTVLGFTNPATHRSVQAPKVDVGAGGPGLHGHVRGVDLTWAVGQALGVNGLADIIVTGLHGALAGAGGMLPQVLAPKLAGPGGPLQAAANAALRHSARAASDYLAAQMAKMGGGAAGGGSFIGPTPAGLGSFDGLPVAQWIVPELAYGRAHGWLGHITSGYRPGYDPHAVGDNSEHRGTSYPHGAVDFGGMIDPVGLANKLAFMAATVGYTGPRLIPAQGFRDDGHMSGTGHAQGGWVGLASGLAPSGSHATGPASPSVPATIAKIKQHVRSGHRKHKARKGRRLTPIERALAPFHHIPDVNNLPGNVDAIKATINALTDQYGLLDTIAGNPNNAYVLDADMPYITPTLLPGEDIHAGMTVVAGQRLYDALMNGRPATPLTDLQGQLLDWMGQQPDHELLDSTMVSILRSTFAQTGVAFAEGTTVPAAQISNMTAQIGDLGHQVAVERHAIGQINAAIEERKTRRRLVDQLAHHAAHRLANLNKDLQRLKSRSLHERLAAAEGSAAVNTRVFDAQTQRNYLSDLIAHERQSTNPDKAAIDGWEQRKRDLDAFIHRQHAPRAHGTDAARIAIARNTIENEKRPLGEDLYNLAGQTTRIGHGGMLGKIDSDIKTLRTGRGDMQTDIASILGSTLPTARLELVGLQQSLPESERPVLPAGSSSTDNSEFDALLRQQNQQLAQALAVSQSQFAIFDNFRAFLPAYEHGGIVKNTGLALVHEGEWITPNPRGPYGSQIGHGGAHHTNVHLHLHGEAGELMKLIDARVESHAPSTVSIVQGQRARALGAAPGGKSKRAY